jgi:hypothetical protein
MTDDDGFRIEAALQLGATEIEGSEVTAYSLSEVELIAFAKACERKGRAEASKLASTRGTAYRVDGRGYAADFVLQALSLELDRMNDATDTDLAPILEAERLRSRAKTDSSPCK